MNNVKIMDTRLEGVNDAILGIDKSDIYGVAYNSVNKYFGAGWSDDQGIYVLAQFLHKFFEFNSAESINTFYFLFIGLGFILYTIGIFLLFKNIKTRIISIIAIVMLTALTYKLRDVYIMFYFTSSFIFIFLYVMKKDLNYKFKLLFLLLVGILLGFSDIFRSHTSTAVLLFISLYIILNTSYIRDIFYKISLLFIGVFLITALWNLTVIEKKNSFLNEVGTTIPITLKHPFWHSVYIGLGYIDNSYVPRYKDKVAKERVKEIDPSIKYLSIEYEEILKKETINLIYGHPLIFLRNISAKFGVMLFYILLFSNFGLYFIWKNIKLFSYRETTPFFIALSFNSLFGFLVIPNLSYLIGFISFIVLFTIYISSKSFEKTEAHNG